MWVALAAAAVVVLGGAATSRSAAQTVSQWLVNGDFENGATGWGTGAATLQLVSDGNVGPRAAKITQSGTPAEYYLYATTRPVSSTVGATTYTANGDVRSASPGKRVCTRVREYADSTSANRLGELTSCITTTYAWQALPPLNYKAIGSGHTLTFHASSPPPPSAPATPSRSTGSASRPRP